MPNVLKIGSYCIYFWSNENLEPIHVHIAEGKTVEHATKIWLTKSGGCIVDNNKSEIPESKLNKMLEVISDNYYLICAKWVEKFGQDRLAYYC